MPEWYILYGAPAIQIAVLSALIYSIFLSVDRHSAGGKIKGMAVILLIVAVAAWGAQRAELHAVQAMLEALLVASPLLLVIIFQPEVRRLFIRMGGVLTKNDIMAASSMIDRLVEAMHLLAEEETGALIVLERGDHFDDYIAAGPFDCAISVRSLRTIFWKNSPVHDGAVIIRTMAGEEGRVVAAGVILPLTQNPVYRAMSGTRHRAAIGISEETDAIAIVVSEENGDISFVSSGKIERGLSRDELADKLHGNFGARARRNTAE